jgi:hypothetical protein
VAARGGSEMAMRLVALALLLGSSAALAFDSTKVG